MARFSDYESVGRDLNMGGADWFKFKAGENKVRLVTEFQEYATHFLKAEKENVTCEGEACEYCFKQEPKRRIQFVGWLLDRADGKFKLASLGWSVFKQIGEYAISNDWGFKDAIPPYDIVVKKSGEGLATEYTVMPSRNQEPLTEEEETQLRELKSPLEIVQKMREKHPGSKMTGPAVNHDMEDDLDERKALEDTEEEGIDAKDVPF